MSYCRVCKREIIFMAGFSHATQDMCGRDSCARKMRARTKHTIPAKKQRIPQGYHMTKDGYIASKTCMRKLEDEK